MSVRAAFRTSTVREQAERIVFGTRCVELVGWGEGCVEIAAVRHNGVVADGTETKRVTGGRQRRAIEGTVCDRSVVNSCVFNF